MNNISVHKIAPRFQDYLVRFSTYRDPSQVFQQLSHLSSCLCILYFTLFCASLWPDPWPLHAGIPRTVAKKGRNILNNCLVRCNLCVIEKKHLISDVGTSGDPRMFKVQQCKPYQQCKPCQQFKPCHIPHFCPYWYTTALFRHLKVHTKKWVNSRQNSQNWPKRPKFYILYANKYTSLKKYTTAGGGGRD